MSRGLDRRTVLRAAVMGGVATLGLPLLEAMLDGRGEALAGGDPLPTRFGVWFWGNGVRPERWVPTRTGTDWTPSSELLPLAGLQDQLSVVSGCCVYTDSHPHHSGAAAVLTGQRYQTLGEVRDTIASTFAAPSVDQLAADELSRDTPLRSLHLGITRFRGSDEGSTFQHLSHLGPNQPNPSLYGPQNVYELLFGASSNQTRLAARRSILDRLEWRGSALQQRLGVNDRQRVEQYLSSVRQAEQLVGLSCEEPGTGPGPFPDVDGREPIAGINQAMSELLALALQCDLTRVFTIQFSPPGSAVIMWPSGADRSLHLICHEEAMPQETVHQATVFTMEQLAGCLQVLADTPEGTGSLLDGCSILCTSELADGRIHSNDDFPLLIAGGGGGRLRPGQHYRSSVCESVSNAVLTALRGAGCTRESFGAGLGYSQRVIESLLA